METTSYHKFDDNGRETTKSNKIWLSLLIITCILLIGMTILAIVFAVNHRDSSNSSNTTTVSPAAYCTATSCLELASDLLNTINETVDPCDDFYHYVCDGWDDKNSWINIQSPRYGIFNQVFMEEMETFLDELFYNTNPSLTNYSSVQKATAYYKTCYDSNVDDETASKSDFVNKLINNTRFTDEDTDTWNSEQINGFNQAMVYLTRNNLNTFFSLQSSGKKLPVILQFADFWQHLKTVNFTTTVNTKFVSLYQTLFNLDANQSQDIGADVAQFTQQLYNISTVNSPNYPKQIIPEFLDQISFITLSYYFDTKVMNYTRLIYDAYGASPTDMQTAKFEYLSYDVSFFLHLGLIIETQRPQVVQYFIWTSIMYYYLDYENIFSQERYQDRTEFCFLRTMNQFPFVYGYILFNKLYNNESYIIASTLAKTIKIDGTEELIKNATWLDEVSKANALKKAENMKLFIGYPPRIKYGDNIDIYYKNAKQSFKLKWIDNVDMLSEFQYELFNNTFWGKGYNLTATWPEVFISSALYPSWLTGINAFYFSLGNWFTIPVSISQPPFLDQDIDYPSSLIFGGLGSVSGHEMSHGFDPSGSKFNYNGTYVGSIFSNYSQQYYQSKMQCFINQYSNISVDYNKKTGQVIYANGTRTITENIADNAGLYSSYTAWKKYINKKGNDKLLYGIDLNQDQLFFVGWARLWCSTNRVGSYVNYTNVHSPNYARIIGPLQNHVGFAHAFNCSSGTRMNPKNKCIVW